MVLDTQCSWYYCVTNSDLGHVIWCKVCEFLSSMFQLSRWLLVWQSSKASYFNVSCLLLLSVECKLYVWRVYLITHAWNECICFSFSIWLELSLKPQIINFCFFSSISVWMSSFRLGWLSIWLIYVTWRTYSLLLYDARLICFCMKYYYKIHSFEI